jgi:tetratricopeptide (TPR) repeat protein
MGPGQREWTRRLERDHGNLRAALDWSVGREEVEIGLRLGKALCRFWQMRGHSAEGRHWLTRVVALAGHEDFPQLRADVLCGLGAAACHQGDAAAGRQFFEQSLSIRRKLGDQAGIALVLDLLGRIPLREGDLATARILFEESLALRRKLSDDRETALSLICLGHVAFFEGDSVRARNCFQESLDHLQQVGDVFLTAWAVACLGYVPELEGNWQEALLQSRHGLRMLAEREPRGGAVVTSIEFVAKALGALGQEEMAAQLFAAAETERDLSGPPLPPMYRANYAPHIAAIRGRLSEERFASAWSAGRTMPLKQAIAVALGEG